MSIFTNVYLVVFSSDQIVTWFPNLFLLDEDSDFDYKLGSARFVYAIGWFSGLSIVIDNKSITINLL
jgi:hypothetical protein